MKPAKPSAFVHKHQYTGIFALIWPYSLFLACKLCKFTNIPPRQNICLTYIHLMKTTLHSRIKEKRIDCGLSQLEFGSSVGVSQPTVANWENGSHVPRPVALSRISQILNVEQAWLVSGTTSVEMNPATPYLEAPIRHIPVYNWPSTLSEIKPENRIGYTPLATESTELIGFQETDTQSGTRTVFILDFYNSKIKTAKAGLVFKNGQLKLAQDIQTEPVKDRKARLHSTFIYYE